jgi:hypothetical protein
MSKCQSCGTEIKWAIRLLTNKRIPLVPLNPAFPNAPRYKTIERSDGQTECERDDQGNWISHFSDCPNAGKHSRKVSA